MHNEVEYGKYNAGEVIRRFRETEADDLLFPSIFVSVIALQSERHKEHLEGQEALYALHREIQDGGTLRSNGLRQAR